MQRPWTFRASAAVAVVATAAAIGLGVWGATKQSTRVVRVMVTVRPSGRVTLFVTNLAPAPPGKTYEAWTVTGGRTNRAGSFDGGRGTALVRLAAPFSPGMRVIAALVPDAVPAPPSPGRDRVFDVSV